MGDGKLRILHVVEAMGGGVFTYLADLTNAMADEFEICIAYAVRPQTPPNFRDYFDSRIQMVEVKNFCRSIDVKKELPAVREVKEIAARFKPDVIHLHSSKAGIIGRAAFDGKKIPVFYTPHGYSFLMQDASSKKRKFYKIIEGAAAKRKCTIISCSKGEHEESLKLTSSAVYVNNGINTEQLSALLKDIKEEPHPFTVFTLGRICFQKNPALFNEIAKALPEVHFLWVGDGELKDELNAPNIEVTGWAERQEALKYAVNADAFILPSLWEGLPLSLLEAMYMKKPCIVSDVVGNHDVIHNGDNGYVCTTVEEYAKAIREIQSNGAQGYINNAYEDILSTYNTGVQAEQYMRIYRNAALK